MDDRLIPVLGVVGLFVLLGLILLLLRLVLRRKMANPTEAEAEAEAEREKHIQEGISRRELDRNPVTGEVFSVCSICALRATEYPPITDKSWLDGLPLLNRLFSLPPRYVIIDNEADGYSLCKIHKKVAIKKLEEFHALVRAERARFNAQQEEKVASMDGGGLHLMVMKQYQDVQAGSAALAEQVSSFGDAHVISAPKESHPQLTMVSTSSVSKPEGDEGAEVEEDAS